MENNNKDFLKNRPGSGIENLNKYQDNFGSAKDSTKDFLTVLFSIILIACAIVCFVRGYVGVGLVFSAIFLLLLVSSIIVEMKRVPVDRTNNSTETIFKDHEEY